MWSFFSIDSNTSASFHWRPVFANVATAQSYHSDPAQRSESHFSHLINNCNALVHFYNFSCNLEFETLLYSWFSLPLVILQQALQIIQDYAWSSS